MRRWRQLQRSLKALKHDQNKIGVLLQGSGSLGKNGKGIIYLALIYSRCRPKGNKKF